MAGTNGVSSTTGVPDWVTSSNYKPTKATDTETDQLANKETFLKLLVAQMQNQNPLNPTDGVQFISQLAQFSDLEQTIQMREELTAIRGRVDEFGAAGSTTEPDIKETKKG